MEESTATVPKDVPLPSPSTALAAQPYGCRPPPSPLSGGYLLIVISETLTDAHKAVILQKLAKAFLSWNVEDSGIDIERELAIVTALSPEGDFAKNGERLIQNASEHLVTEILIHPQINTMRQCIRNLLSSFTKYRFIIHAGYVFCGNGSWILQDGTFSVSDFIDAFQEIEVQRVIRAYEKTVKIDICCIAEGGWTHSRLQQEPFSKLCQLEINPSDKIAPGNVAVREFVDYLEQYIIPSSIEDLLEPSDIVGNIRFTHPTLYVFPGGEGDAALFGINGFNMLVDGGFGKKACFWNFVRHLDRLDAVLMTRVNNSNIGGMSGVMERKVFSHVYPQVGHFFSNLQGRKQLPSPDGDKDREPLLVNLIEEGDHLVMNLKQLQLKPHHCYRDTNSDPINLYHKVGHGKLDMYIISPAKDSREVKEFLTRWNNHDVKLFNGTSKTGNRELRVPLQNLVSICALIVWQPANPDDNITRILFPGSTPQHKIFEGLERLKPLEFLKHSTCTVKSVVPAQTPLVSKPAAKKFVSKLDKQDKILDELAKSEAQVKSALTGNENEMDNGPRSLPVDLLASAGGPIKSTSMKPKHIIGKLIEKAVMKDIKSKTDHVVKEKPSTLDGVTSDKSTADSQSSVGGVLKESAAEKKKFEKKPVQRPVVAPPPKPKLSTPSSEDRKPIESEKSSSTTTPKKSFAEKKFNQMKSSQEKETVSKDKPDAVVTGTSTISSTTTTTTFEKQSSTNITTSKEQSKVSSTATTTAKPISRPAPRTRTPPKVFPAKSLKDENNRKVAESKPTRTAPMKIIAMSKVIKKDDEPIVKAEKKPVVKRTKPPAAPTQASTLQKPAPAKPSSPVKVTRKPMIISSKKLVAGDDKKLKLDNEKTDSSAVSTPSTLEADTTLLKTKTKIESAQSTKEISTKSTAVKKIRPKPKPAETQPTNIGTEPVPIKLIAPTATPEITTYVSNIITKQGDDEDDEILIIETTEMKSIPKDDFEEQKHLRDQTESEKQQTQKDHDASKSKLEQSLDFTQVNETKKSQIDDKVPVTLTPEDKEKIFGEVQGIITTAAEMIATAKPAIDQRSASPVDKPELIKPPTKDPVHGSQETSSTTAPTMPEDEKIDFDEPKQQEEVEEKYDKEDTKEKSQENGQQSKLYAQIPLVEQKPEDVMRKAKRDIVKTPDEVADLPVHEEVDVPEYEETTKDDQVSDSVTVEEPVIEVVKPEHPEYVTITPTSSPDEKPLPTITSHPLQTTKSVAEKPMSLEKDCITNANMQEKINQTAAVTSKSSLEAQIEDNIVSDEFVTVDLQSSELKSPADKSLQNKSPQKDEDTPEVSSLDIPHASKVTPPLTGKKTEKLESGASTTNEKLEKSSPQDADKISSLAEETLDKMKSPISSTELTEVHKELDQTFQKKSFEASLEKTEFSEEQFSNFEKETFDKSSRKESLKEFLEETVESFDVIPTAVTDGTSKPDQKMNNLSESSEIVDEPTRKEPLKTSVEESTAVKHLSPSEEKLDSNEAALSPTKSPEKSNLSQREESLPEVLDKTSAVSLEKSIPPAEYETVDKSSRKESLKEFLNETSKSYDAILSAVTNNNLKLDHTTTNQAESTEISDEPLRKESLKTSVKESNAVKHLSPKEEKLDSNKTTPRSTESPEKSKLSQRKESVKEVLDKTATVSSEKSVPPAEYETVDKPSRKESLKEFLDETSESFNAILSAVTDDNLKPDHEMKNLAESREISDETLRKESLKASEEESNAVKHLSPSEEKLDCNNATPSSISQRKESLKEVLDETSTVSPEKSISPAEYETLDKPSRKESLKEFLNETSESYDAILSAVTGDNLKPDHEMKNLAESREISDEPLRKESLKTSVEESNAVKHLSPSEEKLDCNNATPSSTESPEKSNLSQRKESLKEVLDESSTVSPEKSISPAEYETLDKPSRKESLKEFLNETSESFNAILSAVTDDNLKPDHEIKNFAESREISDEPLRKESLKTSVEESYAVKHLSPSEEKLDCNNATPSSTETPEKSNLSQRKESLKEVLDESSTVSPEKSISPVEYETLDKPSRKESLKEFLDETSESFNTILSAVTDENLKSDHEMKNHTESREIADEPLESLKASVEESIAVKHLSLSEDKLDSNKTNHTPTKSPKELDQSQRKKPLKDELDETSNVLPEKSFSHAEDQVNMITKSNSLDKSGSLQQTEAEKELAISLKKSELFQKKDLLTDDGKSQNEKIDSKITDEKLSLPENQPSTDQSKSTIYSNQSSFDETIKSSRKQSVTFNDESLQIIPSEDLSNDQFIVCKSKPRKKSITNENFLDDDNRISPKPDAVLDDFSTESETETSKEQSILTESTKITSIDKPTVETSPVDQKSSFTTSDTTLEKSPSEECNRSPTKPYSNKATSQLPKSDSKDSIALTDTSKEPKGDADESPSSKNSTKAAETSPIGQKSSLTTGDTKTEQPIHSTGKLPSKDSDPSTTKSSVAKATTQSSKSDSKDSSQSSNISQEPKLSPNEASTPSDAESPKTVGQSTLTELIKDSAFDTSDIVTMLDRTSTEKPFSRKFTLEGTEDESYYKIIQQDSAVSIKEKSISQQGEIKNLKDQSESKEIKHDSKLPALTDENPDLSSQIFTRQKSTEETEFKEFIKETFLEKNEADKTDTTTKRLSKEKISLIEASETLKSPKESTTSLHPTDATSVKHVENQPNLTQPSHDQTSPKNLLPHKAYDDSASHKHENQESKETTPTFISIASSNTVGSPLQTEKSSSKITGIHGVNKQKSEDELTLGEVLAQTTKSINTDHDTIISSIEKGDSMDVSEQSFSPSEDSLKPNSGQLIGNEATKNVTSPTDSSKLGLSHLEHAPTSTTDEKSFSTLETENALFSLDKSGVKSSASPPQKIASTLPGEKSPCSPHKLDEKITGENPSSEPDKFDEEPSVSLPQRITGKQLELGTKSEILVQSINNDEKAFDENNHSQSEFGSPEDQNNKLDSEKAPTFESTVDSHSDSKPEPISLNKESAESKYKMDLKSSPDSEKIDQPSISSPSLESSLSFEQKTIEEVCKTDKSLDKSSSLSDVTDARKSGMDTFAWETSPLKIVDHKPTNESNVTESISIEPGDTLTPKIESISEPAEKKTNDETPSDDMLSKFAESKDIKVSSISLDSAEIEIQKENLGTTSSKKLADSTTETKEETTSDVSCIDLRKQSIAIESRKQSISGSIASDLPPTDSRKPSISSESRKTSTTTDLNQMGFDAVKSSLIDCSIDRKDSLITSSIQEQSINVEESVDFTSQTYKETSSQPDQSITKSDSISTSVTSKESFDISPDFRTQSYSLESQISSELSTNESFDFSSKTPKTPKDISTSPSSDVPSKQNKLEMSSIEKQQEPVESRKGSVVQESSSKQELSQESKEGDAAHEPFDSRKDSLVLEQSLTKETKSTIASLHKESLPLHGVSLDQTDKKSPATESGTKKVQSDSAETKSHHSLTQSFAASSDTDSKPNLTGRTSEESVKESASDISHHSLTQSFAASSDTDSKPNLTRRTSEESVKESASDTSPITSDCYEQSPSKNISPIKPETPATAASQSPEKSVSYCTDAKPDQFTLTFSESTNKIIPSTQSSVETSPSENISLKKSDTDGHSRKESMIFDSKRNSYAFESRASIESIAGSIDGEFDSRSLPRGSIDTYTPKSFDTSPPALADPEKLELITSQSHRDSLADVSSNTKPITESTFICLSGTSEDDPKFASKQDIKICHSQRSNIAYEFDKDDAGSPSTAKLSSPEKTTTESPSKDTETTLHGASFQDSMITPDKQQDNAVETTDSRKSSIVTDTRKPSIPLEEHKDLKKISLATDSKQPESAIETRKSSLMADSRISSLQQDSSDISPTTKPLADTFPKDETEPRKSSLGDSKQETSITQTIQETQYTITESRQSSVSGNSFDQKKDSVKHDFEEEISMPQSGSNVISQRKHSIDSSPRKTSVADGGLDSRKSSTASFIEPPLEVSSTAEKDTSESKRSSLAAESRKVSLGLNLEPVISTTVSTSIETETMVESEKHGYAQSRKPSLSSDFRETTESVAVDETNKDLAGLKGIEIESSINEITTSDKPQTSKTMEIVAKPKDESLISDKNVSPTNKALPPQQSITTDSRKSSISDSRKGSIVADFSKILDSKKSSIDVPMSGVTIESIPKSTTSQISTKEDQQISSTIHSSTFETTTITDKDQVMSIGSSTAVSPSTKDTSQTSTDSRKSSLTTESHKTSSATEPSSKVVKDANTSKICTSESAGQNLASFSDSVTTSTTSFLSQSKNDVEVRSSTSKSIKEEICTIETSKDKKSSKIIHTDRPTNVSSVSVTEIEVKSGAISSVIDTETNIEETKQSSSGGKSPKDDDNSLLTEKTTTDDSSAFMNAIISSLNEQIIVTENQTVGSATIQTANVLSNTIGAQQASAETTHGVTSDSASSDTLQSSKLSAHQLGSVSTLETCNIDLSHRSPSPDFHSHKSTTYTFTTIGGSDGNGSLTETTSRQDLGYVKSLDSTKSDLSSSITTEQITRSQDSHDTTRTTTHITSIESQTSDTAAKSSKITNDDSETITTTTTTSEIITSESPLKTTTQEQPTTETKSSTHVETVTEIDPSSIDLAQFTSLSSADLPHSGANTHDGTYSTIEYQTITKYIVIPSADGSPSRIKKYTTEIIPTSVREMSRAEYEKLHDVDTTSDVPSETSTTSKPTLREMDSKSYDSISQFHPTTTVSSTIRHDPVTKSVSEPKILTSPDSGALHMDANQMRVQFMADSSATSATPSTVKKSNTGAVISKSSSDETYDLTASDTLSDLSPDKFQKKDVSKTVSLPILDEVVKQGSGSSNQPDISEDISKSLTYLEKISYTEGTKSTISSDPSSLNKQPEDGELQSSKSVSLPAIKRPDDSEKYMTLPNLYKATNLEDLTAEDKIIEEKGVSSETLNSDCATASIKETDERVDDENQPNLIKKVIETTTTITSHLVSALQHESSSPQRSQTPCSEDREPDENRSDISLEQCSRITQHSGGAGRDSSQLCESDEDDEFVDSSNVAHLKEDDQIQDQLTQLQQEAMYQMSSSMTQSFYGTYPEEDDDELPEDSRGPPMSTTSHHSNQDPATNDKKDPIKDWGRPLGLPNIKNIDRLLIWNPIEEWGRPLGLPTPAPPPPSMQDRESNGDIEISLAPINPPSNNATKGTPTKKVPKKPTVTEKINTAARETLKTRDSSIKHTKPAKPTSPLYVDLAYVPHHGNPYYTTVEFFKRIRARYYVFSGTDPSKDVFNALIDAKKTWEDQNLEVTIIPTYDTDVLGYWITENEETLMNLKIDLSPSASRCTINLQDHDTSCSAYRLEF